MRRGVSGKTPGASSILAAFGDLETEIDLRQGIILRASHVGIAAPSLSVPILNPPPSFTRPMISTTQPLVRAGDTVQLNGQHFPQNTNLATALPVSLQHEGLSCFGGATALEWGRVGGPLAMQSLPGDANGGCVGDYDATNLTPNTAYQFRARDCDLMTCSPWSVMLHVVTAKSDATNDEVVLTLDGGTPLGKVSVNAQGKFQTPHHDPAWDVGQHAHDPRGYPRCEGGCDYPGDGAGERGVDHDRRRAQW